MTTERTHCAKCGHKLTEKNWVLNSSIKNGVRYEYVKTVCRPCINEREREMEQRKKADGIGPDGATRPGPPPKVGIGWKQYVRWLGEMAAEVRKVSGVIR